jgi:chromosome segregation ATPase
MAKISGKPKLPISNSDLKKAIVERNNSLEKRNKILEVAIKDKEKELKSLEQAYNSETKKLASLSKDVQFEEGRVQKIKSGVFSNKKLLDEKLKKVGKAEKELCEYESAVEKLEDKENKLLDSIAVSELYKSKCEDSKVELSSIHIKKDSLLDELDSINSEIKLSVEEGENKVAYFEAQYDDLEERAKKHEEMVYQFEQRLVETQDLFKDEDSKLKDLFAKSKIEKEQANNELQAIKNLCNNSEDKYIEWEHKVAKAKTQADKEEERNKKAKEHFSKWKIGVLEEVAKLKLKSKVDKIDKAGLSDILNG